MLLSALAVREVQSQMYRMCIPVGIASRMFSTSFCTSASNKRGWSKVTREHSVIVGYIFQE